ncbi:MAG: hypothetical protein U0800_02880 [Isosphaeraceae bacterium]
MIGPGAQLTGEGLKAAADLAEQARIRSLGARRMRVLSYIRAEAGRAGVTLNVQPGKTVQILREGRVVSEAVPVVGLPDARLIYDQERQLMAGLSQAPSVDLFKPYRLIFDGLGILEDRLQFLNWLNKNSELKTLRTEQLREWLANHEQTTDLPGGQRAGA